MLSPGAAASMADCRLCPGQTTKEAASAIPEAMIAKSAMRIICFVFIGLSGVDDLEINVAMTERLLELA